MSRSRGRGAGRLRRLEREGCVQNFLLGRDSYRHSYFYSVSVHIRVCETATEAAECFFLVLRDAHAARPMGVGTHTGPLRTHSLAEFLLGDCV